MVKNLKKGVLVLLVISILSVMFIAASCSTKGGGRGTGKSFRKGTQGLEMDFLTGSPPSEIYAEPGNIPIIIEVRNKGAYPDIGRQFVGELYLSGFDPQILKVSPKSKRLSSEDLFGKSETYQQGGIERIYDFKISDPALYGGESSKQTILATACYQYATLVEAQVCVDPDPYAITIKDKVCSARDTTLSSQGAPVAVTKIEQDKLKDKIQFTIHVKNVGKGKLLDSSKYSNCPNNINYEDLNKVIIEEATLGGRPMTCSPGSYSKPIFLTGKGKTLQGIAVCTTTQHISKQDSAYMSTLNLKLAYAYQDTAQTTVTVLKTPGS